LTTASAPGKIILFGEHAVVSGITALGGAIDLRARVAVKDLPGHVLIKADDLVLKGFSFDIFSGQLASPQVAYATRYVSAVIKEFDARNIQIEIKSDLPLAAGLGSSAAVVVATVAALSRHLGFELSLKDIAATSYRLEKEVQHGLASPTDTALAAFGGYLRISKEISSLDLPSIDMVVGYTGVPHETKSEVEKVQILKRDYPDLVDPIFRAIGSISERAVSLIREQKIAQLGQMMNINHGLLEALGVSSRELGELVYAARGAGGALGSKLTGAGGGGSMIALPGHGLQEALMTAIRQARGVPFGVKVGSDGVRLEKDS
jgi:mevalonate kinase